MDPYFISIILFMTSILLAGVDIFVPSGGLLLILAVAAAVGAILFGFRSSTTLGMTMLTLVAAAVPIGAFLAIKIWPHTPIGRLVILRPPEQQVPVATNDPAGLEVWLGKVLKADADLMPAGQLKIGYRRMNAVAESGFVEAGQAVKVVAIRERSLVVRVTSEPLTPLVPESRPGAQAPQGAEQLAEPNLLDVPAEELGLDSIDERPSGSS